MERKKCELIQEVASLSMVKAIGETGDPNQELIPGQSDIDLFVLCDQIPTNEERESTYIKKKNLYTTLQMSVCSNCIWGTGDILQVNGIDVMFMYFTIQEMEDYLREVLDGKRMWKEGDFYPTGRLASIHDLHIWYEEKDEFSRLVHLTEQPPEGLFQKLYEFHKEQILEEEGLGRSMLRKDPFYYHQVLENGLDHFLQAVFALNHVYFPSRKRTQKYLESFTCIPNHCVERLKEIMKNSVDPFTIPDSIVQFRTLTNELFQIAEQKDNR